MEVELGGAAEFRALAKRLEEAAGSDVVIETLGKALDGLYPEMVRAVHRGADRLPHAGGLDVRVAQTRILRKVLRRNGVYQLTLVADRNAVADPGAINRGRVKHPTFGHRPSVIQLVKPGWFSAPLEQLRPKIRHEIEEALKQAQRKV